MTAYTRMLGLPVSGTRYMHRPWTCWKLSNNTVMSKINCDMVIADDVGEPRSNIWRRYIITLVRWRCALRCMANLTRFYFIFSLSSGIYRVLIFEQQIYSDTQMDEAFCQDERWHSPSCASWNYVSRSQNISSKSMEISVYLRLKL